MYRFTVSLYIKWICQMAAYEMNMASQCGVWIHPSTHLSGHLSQAGRPMPQFANGITKSNNANNVGCSAAIQHPIPNEKRHGKKSIVAATLMISDALFNLPPRPCHHHHRWPECESFHCACSTELSVYFEAESIRITLINGPLWANSQKRGPVYGTFHDEEKLIVIVIQACERGSCFL